MFTVPSFVVKSSREKDGRGGNAKARKLQKETKEGTVFIDDVDFVCWLTDFVIQCFLHKTK